MIYDVIVAGLGAMGSATLAHAARRGMHALGIERYGRAHDQGSSGGRSRIIRKAYFESPAYVPLVRRAYDLWLELQAQTGLDLLRETGVLLTALPDDPVVVNAGASARLHDIPIVTLTAAELRRRYPRLAPRDAEIGILEPEAGLLVPEASIEAHLRVAEDAGAQVRIDMPIAGWTEAGDGTLAVRLDDGSAFRTRRLAVCLGAWFPEIARSIGIPLVVERRVAHWFAPGAPGFGPADVPTFIINRPELPSALYGFPDVGEGLKAAFHMLGAATTPATLDRSVHDADIEPVRNALEAWIPGSTRSYAGGKVCMYTLTPDANFVLGLHPHDNRIALAGGFSGHGFKFASAIGEVMADLLESGATRHDIAFLSPRRFAAVA